MSSVSDIIGDEVYESRTAEPFSEGLFPGERRRAATRKPRYPGSISLDNIILEVDNVDAVPSRLEQGGRRARRKAGGLETPSLDQDRSVGGADEFQIPNNVRGHHCWDIDGSCRAERRPSGRQRLDLSSSVLQGEACRRRLRPHTELGRQKRRPRILRDTSSRGPSPRHEKPLVLHPLWRRNSVRRRRLSHLPPSDRRQRQLLLCAS